MVLFAYTSTFFASHAIKVHGNQCKTGSNLGVTQNGYSWPKVWTAYNITRFPAGPFCYVAVSSLYVCHQ